MTEIIQSPARCGKVVRHALSNVTPGEPDDRRRRAKVAEKLSKGCSGSLGSAQIRPTNAETWQISPEVGQHVVKVWPKSGICCRKWPESKFGRAWPDFGQIVPTLVSIYPSSTSIAWFGSDVGQIWANIGQTGAKLDHNCPMWAKFWTPLANFRQTLASFAQLWSSWLASSSTDSP